MAKTKADEQELLAFLTKEERRVYDEYERKLKVQRDLAVKRQKAEQAFWKQVDAREAEVYKYLSEKRQKRQAPQSTRLPAHAAVQNAGNADVTGQKQAQ